MKLAGLLLVLCLATVPLLGDELVVYTYRSFVNWGPASEIQKAFEEAFPDTKLVWVAPAGAAEMMARLIAELSAGRTDADVFLGIPAMDLGRALAHEVFLPYDAERIPNVEHVPEELMFDTTGHVIPFDHDYVTFNYDTQRLPEELVPATFEDLLRPELRGRIILQDPRTSGTGQAFLLWTIAHFGDDWPDFWRALVPNTLTITRGWSEAFAMFEAGEAPIMLSFAASPAYTYLVEGSQRYRAVALNGEAARYIEGMGIVRTSEKPELAHALLDIILSREIQELIPTSQWMFPVHREAELPEGFADVALQPERAIFLDPAYVAENLETWLNTWQGTLDG